eukprot:Lankesteria_metandrocarpae@DN4530_c0_g1_i3.p1
MKSMSEMLITSDFDKGVTLRRLRQSDWDSHLESDRLNSNAHLRVATFQEMKSAEGGFFSGSLQCQISSTSTSALETQSLTDFPCYRSASSNDVVGDGKHPAPMIFVSCQKHSAPPTSVGKAVRSQGSVASTTSSVCQSFDKPTVTSEIGFVPLPNLPYAFDSNSSSGTSNCCPDSKSLNSSNVPSMDKNAFHAYHSTRPAFLPHTNLTARRGASGPLSACERLSSKGPISRGENFLKLIEGKIKFRRVLERGIMLFNNSPDEGLEYLQNEKLVNLSSPGDVAEFLLLTAGLNKHSVVQILSRSDSFSQKILHNFIGYFDFRGLTLDEAFRYFLSRVQLKGEAQIIERIVLKFAERFAEDLTNSKWSLDRIFLVTYALIMLNTDLHNKNNKKHRMTREEFVQTMARCDVPFTKSCCNSMYNRISLREFKSSMSPIDFVYERLSFDPRALAFVGINSEEASKIDFDCLHNGFTLMKLCRSRFQRHERLLWLSSDRQLLCWAATKLPSSELELAHTENDESYVRPSLCEYPNKPLPKSRMYLGAKRGVAPTERLWTHKGGCQGTTADSHTLDPRCISGDMTKQKSEGPVVKEDTEAVDQSALESASFLKFSAENMYTAVNPKKTKRELLKGAANHQFYDETTEIACANLVNEAFCLVPPADDTVDLLSLTKTSKTRAILRSPVDLLGSIVRSSVCKQDRVTDSWTERQGVDRHAGATFGCTNDIKWVLLSSLKEVTIGSAGSAVMRRNTQCCPVVSVARGTSWTRETVDKPVAEEPYHILTNHVSIVCKERTLDFIVAEDNSAELLEYLKYLDCVSKRNYKRQVKKAVQDLRKTKQQRRLNKHQKLIQWQRLMPKWSMYCSSCQSRSYISACALAPSRVRAPRNLSKPEARAALLAAVKQFADTSGTRFPIREQKAQPERGVSLTRAIRLIRDNSDSSGDGNSDEHAHTREQLSHVSLGHTKQSALLSDFVGPISDGVPDILRPRVWMIAVTGGETHSDSSWYDAARDVIDNLKTREAELREINIESFCTRFPHDSLKGVCEYFRDVDISMALVRVKDAGIPVEIPCVWQINAETLIHHDSRELQFNGCTNHLEPPISVVRRHTCTFRHLISRTSSTSSAPPESATAAPPLPPMQAKHSTAASGTPPRHSAKGRHHTSKSSPGAWRSSVESRRASEDEGALTLTGPPRRADARRVSSESRSTIMSRSKSTSKEVVMLSSLNAKMQLSSNRQSLASLMHRKKSKVSSCSTTACCSDFDEDSDSSTAQTTLSILGIQIFEAFCFCRPEIGFISGLDRVTPILSYYLRPADAVKLLTSLMEKDNRFFYQMFTCAPGHVEKHIALFDVLLDTSIPDLAAYFRCLGLDISFFWFHWLYSLFQVALPMSVALRCWDLLFVDPRAYAYSVSLSLLAHHSSQLQAYSLSECMRVLHSPPCIFTFKEDEFITRVQAFHLQCSSLEM